MQCATPKGALPETAAGRCGRGRPRRAGGKAAEGVSAPRQGGAVVVAAAGHDQGAEAHRSREPREAVTGKAAGD
jgi:hypothetical protein